MFDKLEAEVELIKGTIRDLSESIARLEEQRDKLNAEIGAKRERRLAWETRLAQLEDEIKEPFGTTPKPGRRRKGENMRAIRDLLAANKDRGFSVKEVADTLRIAWSSTRRALQENPIFVEHGDLWYLKQLATQANGDEKDS
jgi:chromosome segregation ATPase